MPEYRSVAVRREICVERLHSLYYFQLAPTDPLEGESHPFWELVYMDAEEAQVVSESDRFPLRQGEMFLHRPGRYHQLRLIPGHLPSVLILSFSADCAELDAVSGRPRALAREQRQLLSRILAEGTRLYGPVLDLHRDLDADRRMQAEFGCLQAIVSCLELFLIDLLRQRRAALSGKPPLETAAGERPETIVGRLKEYMRCHLSDNLTFADCCAHLGMSGTALKAVFRAQREKGVMHCYQRMRVSEARRLLRGGACNVTEVAARLGYSSCQAFSSQFRRLTGVSPKAYLRQVADAPELIITRPVQAKRRPGDML